MKYWIAGAWAVFAKDLRLEFRSRYAISVLLMFVLASLLLMVFGIGQQPVSARVQSALLWIVILFAASIGLGRAFIQEEERGTVLLLRLTTRGSMVYAGKLLFNFLLLLLVNLVALLAFAFLLNVRILHWDLLISTLVLGSLGLAGASTLLGALIARAANRGPMLPVLMFPTLLPLLLSVVGATRSCLEGGFGWAAARTETMTLISFAGVVITLAFLLFDYVWDD